MATITGTSSAETLANNAGVSDTITGLAGHDTFVYSRTGAAETDVMTDFGSTYFSADLEGENETPPTGSSASGTLTAALARGNLAFSFSVHETGLDLGGQTPTSADNVSLAHFHVGAEDEAGPVVYGFIGSPNNDLDGDTHIDAPNGNVSGVWDGNEGASTTLSAQINNLLNGDLYINFHTTPHPAGEIRGQVLAVDQGLDRLDVTGANIGDFATMQFLLHDVSGSAEFATTFDGAMHTMRFQGVTEANLHEADFIFAGAVAEVIHGTDNADDLFGAGGKDKLMGGTGDDRLFGESGTDSLTAGKGADLLMGGTGNDKLVGEADQDTLTGGTGKDTFILEHTKDSKSGATHRDIITDFSHAEHDRIDLHKIDADTLTKGDQEFFLGEGGDHFTGVAGELIQVTAGGATILSGDVDGDGQADFQIQLSGNPTLVADDFAF